MIKQAKPKDFAFYIFLVLYGTVLVFLAWKLNVWEDEAYSLHTTSPTNNLVAVISQSYNFEGQSPFYFILLSIWRLISPGIFFSRLFSLICLGFSAYYFNRLAILISGKKFAEWMLVIFLLNPFTVWAGLEIRLYALAMLLSAALLYYFLLFYLDGKKKHLYLVTVISLIGLYTQYLFVLEIGCLALILLVFKGWNAFFKLALYLLPVAILFIPNLFYIHQQVSMLQSHKPDYNVTERVLNVFYALQELLLAIPIVPEHFKIRHIIRLIFVVLVNISYYRAYKRSGSGSFISRINLIIASGFILSIFYILLFVVTGIIFQSKYMAIAFPFFILVFTLFKFDSDIYSKIIYGCFSIYFVVLLFLNYRNPIKNYDFISVGKFVQKIENPKEPILFYSKSLLPPFRYYYNGQNPLISLPPIKFDKHYYEEYITDTTQFMQELDKVPLPSQSCILVTDNSQDYKYNTNINPEMVDECLNSNFTITLDTTFLGQNKYHQLRVRRLQAK